MASSNTASMLHAIAEELGCDPELVGVVRQELKLRKRDDIKHATQERLSQMADSTDAPEASTEETVDEKPPKEKKAGLTLSQRRALLKLLDADSEGIAPATGFKSLPYDKLVEVGYATQTPSDDDAPASYTLTAKGRERAESINPGYRVWSAGESVAGDESRPVAGTHRQTKAEADAAKAAADAEAAESKPEGDDEPQPAVEEGETIPAEIGEPVDA